LTRCAALLVLLAACRGRGAPVGARSVTDGMGRAVRLPATVARVVSLAPSSTEILFAIGAGATVVGLDRYSDWPPQTARVEKVGANLDPSLERVVALRPDVVFTNTSANNQATVEGLERLGLAVFVSRSEGLEAIYRDVQAIGDAVGRSAAASRLAADLRARVEAVRARARGAPPVRTLVVVWPDPLVVAGPTTHVSDLLAAVGAVNVADDTRQSFPTYSLERVIARAPEALIVGTHSNGPPSLAALERLTTVPAVRDRRVFTVDGDLLFRPGPRVADAVERLAELLRGPR
jgi:iron complex transport system substrate-binding protein